MSTLNNLMLEDISLLYESVLINEMTQDVVDYLDQHKEDLPFSNLFGDKLRLVVPIGGDLTAREILEDLKTLRDYSGVDVGTGEVIRKIKLDPKYGKGSEKEQKMNIGKAVNSLKIDPEKKKKYLDWLAKYKDNLNAALSDISDYVMILSRAPIDVVRMSDHRNISSCHSKGGSYFHCAVQEAMTGGAVAYVVDRDLLDYHLKDGVEALQNEDFFMDSERGVDGIRPISRLRVRRIESINGQELAIPDDRVYGDSTVPGFKKYLDEFLKRYQEKEIRDFVDSEGRGWESRGGSYYDTSIGGLVDEFIGISDISRVYHSSEDSSSENDWSTRGWDDELSGLKDYWNQNLQYCNVDYYIEPDDDPYIIPSGGCKLDISKFNLPDDMELSVDDSYYIRRVINGSDDDEYLWSGLVNYLKEKVDDAGISRLYIDNTKIEISFLGDDNSLLRSPDQFDDFCRDVSRFDRQIEDMLEDPDELLLVFQECGFLENSETDFSDPNYSRYADYEQNDPDYKTIELHGATRDMNVVWKDGIFAVSPVKEPPRQPTIRFSQWPHLLQKFIYNFANENFHPKIKLDDGQKSFSNFFENFTNSMEDINFTILPFQVYPTQFSQSVNKYTYFPEKIKLVTKGFDNKHFEFFDFLDEIYPHIKNFFKMAVLMTISRDDPEMFEYYKHHNLPQLEKLYGKYID